MSDQTPPPPPPGGPPPPDPPSYGSGPFAPAPPTPPVPPDPTAQYQQPYYAPQGRPTNGMAIASLIMGLGGFTFLPGLGSILALIFGYIGKGQIARSQGAQDGRGLALAGIVLGWIGVVFMIVIAGLIAAGIFFAVSQSEAGVDGIIEEFQEELQSELPGVVPEAAAGCGPIENHEDQGTDHIRAAQAARVTYNSNPPTSGPHFDVAAEPGFYTTPVAPPTLVHNLEHGQIVVWYDADADAATLDQLAALTAQEPIATVASPYEDMPEGFSYVLTGWTHSRSCTVPSQEVFDDFRRRFQGRAPEQLTPPFTG